MFANEEILAIRKIILQAGDAIMEVYNRDDFAVESKADQSPVTEADLAADAIIYPALEAHFPTHRIITEERAETHKAAGKTFFIVDPLDGTKEFVKRRGEFTVNIGFVENGLPVFGMVYAPVLGRLFLTKDGEAFEEKAPFDQDNIGNLQRITTRQADNNALLVVASKSHRDQATDDYIHQYQNQLELV